jgi:hypothetical protein
MFSNVSMEGDRPPWRQKTCTPNSCKSTAFWTAPSHAFLDPPYLAIDKSCQWQIVEEVGEELPHTGVPVLADALVVEPIPAQLRVRRPVTSQSGQFVGRTLG